MKPASINTCVTLREPTNSDIPPKRIVGTKNLSKEKTRNSFKATVTVMCQKPALGKQE
jgi:hypothetical protein